MNTFFNKASAPTLEQIYAIADQSRDLSPYDFNTSHSDDVVKTRDAFLELLKRHPVETFAPVADHPFWPHWVSKKSGSSNNILGVAVGLAQDPRWIEALSKIVPSRSHFVEQAVHRPLDQLMDTLRFCLDNGLWDISNEKTTNYVVRSVIRRGCFDILPFMWERGLYKERVQENENTVVVENDLLNRDALLGTTHQEALEKLWGVWGAPSLEQSKHLWMNMFKCSRKSQSSQLYKTGKFLEENFGPSHKDWGTQIGADFFVFFLRRDRFSLSTEFLNKIETNWFSEDVISQGMSQVGHQVTPDAVAQISRYILNHQIEKHLADTQTSKTTHRRKM